MDRAIHLLTDPQPLRDPVLITAVQGAGTLAPGAVAALFERYEPEPIAEIDTDEFYDFTVVRPLTRIADSERLIQWPQVRFLKVSLADQDLVVLTALEPNVAWRRMGNAIREVAEAFGIREVVQLSSFTGATPHTRPIPLQWLAVSPHVPARFGRDARRPRYQGPATFSMALGAMLRDAGVTVGVLNVIAPFYLGVEPSPHAVRTLARALAEEFGVRFDLDDIEQQIAEVERQAAVQREGSPHLRMFLANLEQQYDDMQGLLTDADLSDGIDSSGSVGRSHTVLEPEHVLADVEAILRSHGRPGSPERGESPPA